MNTNVNYNKIQGQKKRALSTQSHQTCHVPQQRGLKTNEIKILIPIKSRGPPIRGTTHHQGLFIKTSHCTTKSISSWGMQPCLKWCKGNKSLSIFVISTCFCDFYLCFVISTCALQINTIKPPRVIYIDSSHFLTKNNKVYKTWFEIFAPLPGVQEV